MVSIWLVILTMSDEAKSPKDRAVEAAGGVTKLAEALSITRSAVSQWDEIPMERVFEVSRVTGVPVHELRPDLIPAPQDAA
jgi:DNA-binding transcriptional regulator YdaS (Cro superfamily)